MKRITYGEWTAHPKIVDWGILPPVADPIWRREMTKHEGETLYYKFWNFWVRVGATADLRSNLFFRDYESANADTDKLLRDVGFRWKKAETEREVWDRIGLVWSWLKTNVRFDSDRYGTISSLPDSWPSILDYAKYYVTHGNLVWAACFSKAHLFTSLLGRMIYPRFRFAIAEAHHSEGGVPATATHVYGAAYVHDRWFYLDPTAVEFKAFPDFDHPQSVGVDSFTSVDYEHPYEIIPIPLSGFDKVPLLPK